LYWDLQYKTLIRDNGDVTIGGVTERAGHNYIFDTVAGRYDLVTTDGTTSGKRIYETAELNDLFTVSW
jgi:hypothetical protein